jgi:hypothetical protein
MTLVMLSANTILPINFYLAIRALGSFALPNIPNFEADIDKNAANKFIFFNMVKTIEY